MDRRYTAGKAEWDEKIYGLFDALLEAARGYIKSPDEERLYTALQFAAYSHKKMLRKDGTPYITHPLETAIILADLAMDQDTLAAALLHDVIEDTPCTYADIVKYFGGTVAELVEGVTKLTKMPYASKEDHQMENLRKMLLAMSRDIRVLIIKIADRLHNMRTIEYHTEAKRREKSLETMQIYAPLAHRLGINKIKMELEDLSFQCLDPVAYQEIQLALAERLKGEAGFLEQVCADLQENLDKAGISARIESRVKQIYSIYRKMYIESHRAIFEIYDLYAVRVIVENQKDCYNVLGIVHDVFHALPGRLKDYISNPKPNGYQSIHATVIGRKGVPFEVQIRTVEMHETAEYGIAAHWKYKDKASENDPALDEGLKWVRMLLEAQQDAEPEEFVKSLRTDMFEDVVFVFTPKGDVVNLPMGSTPIDFAYNIHSAVGNRMTGAKVNGKIVPFEYRLMLGDVVEVLSQGGKGPSRDWLKIVKTSEARSKIKQWFKREKREENIQQGRADLESELRRGGIQPETLKQDGVLPVLLKKMSFATFDDLCGAIGFGGISALKAVNRIRDELIRLNHLQTEKDVVGRMMERMKKPKPHGSASAVMVEDIDHCQVKFSRCCAPVPGDRITGFVTKGYGISIHRAGCQNAVRSREKEPERWVGAQWIPDETSLYETGVKINCFDREGLTLDISTVLAALKVSMSSYTAQVLDEGRSLISIVLRVKDLQQFDFVIGKLRLIPNVVEITRTGS